MMFLFEFVFESQSMTLSGILTLTHTVYYLHTHRVEKFRHTIGGHGGRDGDRVTRHCDPDGTHIYRRDKTWLG